MLRAIRLAAPILVLAAAVACGGGQSEAPQQASAPPPDAKTVDPATAGAISGRIAVDGQLPPNPTLSMASDPICLRANEGGMAAESYVASDGGLENVFVYIKEGLDPKYYFETPTQPATIDQQGCRYHPHVIGVRVGQPLQIANSDSTLHNVHGVPERNQEFNFGQPIAGMKNAVTFTAPEVMIPFKCDVHSWMSAYVGVVNNPYFAVSGKGGAFDLKNVPPGTYTIEAWHEKLGTQTQQVTIGNKEQKQITFTFKAAAP